MRVWKSAAAATLLIALALGGCGGGRPASTADGEFCEVVNDYVPAEDCAVLAKQAEKINAAGHAAFKAPDGLKRSERFTVTLAVADAPREVVAVDPAPPPTDPPKPPEQPHPTPAPEDPQPPPTTTTPEATAAEPPPPVAPTPAEVIQALPGRKLEYDLAVGPRMVADLEGDDGFEVTPISPREQRVHMGAPYSSTVWRWQITAKRGGAHTLSIKTAVQAVDSTGKLHELAATPQVYSFTVLAQWPGTWIDKLAGWTDDIKEMVSFVDALKALAVAVVGLLGALGIRSWLKKRRAAKPPSDSPPPTGN